MESPSYERRKEFLLATKNNGGVGDGLVGTYTQFVQRRHIIVILSPERSSKQCKMSCKYNMELGSSGMRRIISSAY